MRNFKIILNDTKRKAFTLIELLIVVAIIGILAGVGVPMYNGYMASAKLESAKTNHSNVKTFVAATLTKCSTTGGNIQVGSSSRKCGDTAAQWAPHFRVYFDGINKNPFDSSVASTTAGAPTKGQTQIYEKGGNIGLKTSLGIVDGKALYTPESGYDYILKE
jgi:type IV pilus assembly protein PilA